EPARMDLGFLQGFLHILHDTLDETRLACLIQRCQRPGTDERLIEEILFIGIGHLNATNRTLLCVIPPLPALHGTLPLAWDLGQDVDPRPHILAAFCVMRRGRQEAAWPLGQALSVALMKGV